MKVGSLYINKYQMNLNYWGKIFPKESDLLFWHKVNKVNIIKTLLTPEKLYHLQTYPLSTKYTHYLYKNK